MLNSGKKIHALCDQKNQNLHVPPPPCKLNGRSLTNHHFVFKSITKTVFFTTRLKTLMKMTSFNNDCNFYCRSFHKYNWLN